MNNAARITGAALLTLGLALFGWKIFFLGLPLVPSDPEGLWAADLAVQARGGPGTASVTVALPESEPGQVIFDERSVSEGLSFAVRSHGGQRLGVWSGPVDGAINVAAGFRVQLNANTEPKARTDEQTDDALLGATIELPARAPEVQALLERLRLADVGSEADRARMAFAFVNDEVGIVPTGSDDAILTLASREGSPSGKTRLLATLLRAAEVPSRVVVGVRLERGTLPTEVPWVEAYAGGRWISMSPTEGFFGNRPPGLLVMRRGSLNLVEATGVDAVVHRFHAIPERLRPDELATMMSPSSTILESLSLYRLPVATQNALRALLLLPLGGLAVSFFRNIVGLPTFGTFMPILIAYTLRETSLGLGLVMVFSVLAIGILTRVLLDRLHLLMVPRLSILLCIVVLVVVLLALWGRGLDQTDLFSGVLFPIVILTMLVERFSITLAEEGLRGALVKAGWSVLIAVAVYPVFRSVLAEHIMFGFPELLFVVMGILVWMGAYTGYRVSDLIRFRSFAQERDDS